MLNSKEYWIKREQQKLEGKLKREFAKASKKIKNEINTLFQRYAKDNAKKQLDYLLV
ncbi:MAG: hypothetical protein ACRCVJ_10395 [Clostridium sp.]|uniref:hypothetical protein n=1 Tax=Clostridium sp. TaxID=1506 RepID=UPI003F303525